MTGQKAVDLELVGSLVRRHHRHTGQPSVAPVVLLERWRLGELLNLTRERGWCEEAGSSLAWGWSLGEPLAGGRGGGDATSGRRQRRLDRASWDVDAARDRLQALGRETLGDSEGIGVLDETGSLWDSIERRLDGEPLRDGVASVGVERPRWGAAGTAER